MQARGHLAGRPAGRGRCRGPRPRTVGPASAGLADKPLHLPSANREYDLVDGPDGMALLALPGTGLGILRHDKQGSTSFAALPP